MRSLLTLGKTLVSCVLATSFSAALVRGETITWIDPPETRSIGVAEASGAKSLDVDHATVTRGSLAVLDSTAPNTVSAPVVTAPASIVLPLAVKTTISATDAVAKKSQPVGTLPWLAINARSAAKGIDPYPTWSGAALVIDDVTTVRDDRSETGGYQATARSLNGKSLVMVGERFFGL